MPPYSPKRAGARPRTSRRSWKPRAKRTPRRPAALRWQDVEFRADGSARITVRRSKTDQKGEGAVQYVGRAAAKALRKIRGRTGSRVVGLRSGRSVANRLRAAGRAAGVEGLSGYSGRVGMARDLVAAGAGVAAVQVAGRWKPARMPAHYARAE